MIQHRLPEAAQSGYLWGHGWYQINIDYGMILWKCFSTSARPKQHTIYASFFSSSPTTTIWIYIYIVNTFLDRSKHKPRCLPYFSFRSFNGYKYRCYWTASQEPPVFTSVSLVFFFGGGKPKVVCFARNAVITTCHRIFCITNYITNLDGQQRIKNSHMCQPTSKWHRPSAKLLRNTPASLRSHRGWRMMFSSYIYIYICILLYKQEATRVSWPLLLGTRSYSVVSCAAQTSRCSKKHIACWNRAPEAASWWWSLSAAGGDRRTTRHRRPFPVRWDRRISS